MPDPAQIEQSSNSDSAATLTGQLGLYELQPGDKLVGRFRIESMLGVGGMGMVYRAFDESLDIPVAIKLLRPELARRPEAFERFRQELLLARQVSSPHVVRIHDIARDEGRWFISMDFIDGESLEARMDRVPKPDTDEALRITHDLLEGLGAAHRSGVVHRDLKPGNVLLDGKGCAYITDFGVARSLGATGMTHTGMIIGTPEYLSPEQARGVSVDTRSDLYTVGLILYEMLAGSLPFGAGTAAETVMQRIVRPPPSLARVRPDLPRWLCAFVDRLLKLNPARRFANAAEALRALETRRVPRPPLNRRALLLMLLALVSVAGIVDWTHRYLAERPASAAAPVAHSTETVAVLPFAHGGGDAQAALARAISEHLHAWLRGDAEIGVIPRRRVLSAIARTAPDTHGSALLRLLPVVANAANATRVLHGELGTHAGNLTLRLQLTDAQGKPVATALRVDGHDVNSLFAAYRAAAPAFLAGADIDPGPSPTLVPAALPALGRALMHMDGGHPGEAVKELLGPASAEPNSALIASVLLRAEEGSGQTLPAQNQRQAVIGQFATATDPVSLRVYAHALDGDQKYDAAAKALAHAVHAYPHDADIVLDQADSLRANDHRQQAIELLRHYLTAEAEDDASGWFLLGRTAIEHGEARSAVGNYLLHALVIDTLSRDASAEATTRNAMGIGYERLGQLDAAAEQYQRAIDIRQRLGEQEELAKSLRNLAIVQAEQGKRKAAEQTLNRARDLLTSLGDRTSIAYLYNDRGVVAEENGDFGEALKYYRQAYALRQQLDDPAAIAESLNNIGFCSYRMGDFDNASVYWTQALTQYRKLGDRNGMLHIQQSMGLLDIAHGRFDAARTTLTDSLNYAEQHQLAEEAAVAQISLGELALLQGRYSDARSAADQAARIFARRADERGQSEAAVLGARVALALGDAVDARKRLAAIDRAKLNDEQQAEFHRAQAQLAALRGNAEARAEQLDLAAGAAARAHSGALASRVDLDRVRLDLAARKVAAASKLLTRVSQQTSRLTEVPLRLQWLELEIAASLDASHAGDAANRYREAVGLLRSIGRYADASLIHQLGERALAGRSVEAAAARKAAVATRNELLGDAPKTARGLLQAELNRRWREQVGSEDGI